MSSNTPEIPSDRKTASGRLRHVFSNSKRDLDKSSIRISISTYFNSSFCENAVFVANSTAFSTRIKALVNLKRGELIRESDFTSGFAKRFSTCEMDFVPTIVFTASSDNPVVETTSDTYLDDNMRHLLIGTYMINLYCLREKQQNFISFSRDGENIKWATRLLKTFAEKNIWTSKKLNKQWK